MKVITALTFCCNKQWKSIVYGSGKSLANSGNYISPTLWSPWHVNVLDGRNWELASGTSWHVSGRYGCAMRCIVLNMSIAVWNVCVVWVCGVFLAFLC